MKFKYTGPFAEVEFEGEILKPGDTIERDESFNHPRFERVGSTKKTKTTKGGES